MNSKINNIKGFLFDLDGVIYIGDDLIDGAKETINYLKEQNYPIRFLTNTTTRSFDSLYEKLEKLELPIEKDELFSPPKIAEHYLSQFDNPTVCLILEEETKPQFQKFQIDNENPNFIVIGHYGERWDYKLMQHLFDMIMNGSKILALHKGRYWQTERGLTLDIGAFVAGLEHATSTKAIEVGKPSSTFFNIALQDMNISASDALMVGDDIINDIKGAQDVGMYTALVKTGKYRKEIVQNSGIEPSIIIESIAEIKYIMKQHTS